jgi:hypothetical protein
VDAAIRERIGGTTLRELAGEPAAQKA